MSAIALVYTLVGDRPTAESLAREMVTGHLAACANILTGSRSLYPWAGALEEADEVPLLFKTSPYRKDALMAALASSHPYDLPAILSWPAEATPAYAAWVADQTAG